MACSASVGALLLAAPVFGEKADVPKFGDGLVRVVGLVDDPNPGLGEGGESLTVGSLARAGVEGTLGDVLGAAPVLDGGQDVLDHVLVVFELGDQRGVGEGEGVGVGGGLGDLAGVRCDGGLDDLAGGAQPFGDAAGGHAEDGELFDGGEPVGVGEGVAAFVLVPLLGDPLRLAVVVGDDEHRHGGQAHLDRAEGAALAPFDGQGAVIGTGGVDGVHDPELAQRREELPVQVRLGAHVIAEDEGRGVNVYALVPIGCATVCGQVGAGLGGRREGQVRVDG